MSRALLIINSLLGGLAAAVIINLPQHNPGPGGGAQPAAQSMVWENSLEIWSGRDGAEAREAPKKAALI